MNIKNPVKHGKRYIAALLLTVTVFLLVLPFTGGGEARSGVDLLAVWKTENLFLAILLILLEAALAVAVVLECLWTNRKSTLVVLGLTVFALVDLLVLLTIGQGGIALPGIGGILMILCLVSGIILEVLAFREQLQRERKSRKSGKSGKSASAHNVQKEVRADKAAEAAKLKKKQRSGRKKKKAGDDGTLPNPLYHPSGTPGTPVAGSFSADASAEKTVLLHALPPDPSAENFTEELHPSAENFTEELHPSAEDFTEELHPSAEYYSQNRISATSAAQEAHGKLHIGCGTLGGSVIPLEHMVSVTIGKDASLANLVVEEPSVSRKHCIVTYNEVNNSYLLLDLSTNGTYLENGQRIPRNYAMELPSGQLFYIGVPQNRFRLGAEAAGEI